METLNHVKINILDIILFTVIYVDTRVDSFWSLVRKAVSSNLTIE